MSSSHSLGRVAPLFLVLFIDGMGLSLLFPIINSLIIDTSSSFLSPSVALPTREFLYGFIISIYMLCWFFGAAILGDVSDVAGRKKALMTCLIGAGLGYLLSGFAVNSGALIWLVLGRVVAGLTAGSQPIAQAAIVDVSTPQSKARNIGLILLSISLGFVLGPLIGGVLSDNQFVHWFNFSTPLYFAAALSFVNAFLLHGLFKETWQPKQPLKLRLHRAIEIFVSAFKHPRIRHLSLVLLIFIFGWSNFYTFVPLYVHEIYGYSALTTSIFMAVMGVGFAVSCGFLVDFCSKRFDKVRCIVISTFIAAALSGLIVILNADRYLVWIFTALVGAAVCLSYSLLITLFSDVVSASEQGWVMGVTGSIMALCFGVTSLAMGWLVDMSIQLPLWLACVGMTVAAWVLSIRRV